VRGFRRPPAAQVRRLPARAARGRRGFLAQDRRGRGRPGGGDAACRCRPRHRRLVRRVRLAGDEPCCPRPRAGAGPPARGRSRPVRRGARGDRDRDRAHEAQLREAAMSAARAQGDARSRVAMRAIVLLAVVLLAAMWLATWQRSQFEMRQAITAAQLANANLAIAYEENTDNALGDVDQLTRMIAVEYREEGRGVGK